MTRRVLVAYDGSLLAERGLAFAASEFPDDDVVALYVVDRERDPTAMKGWGDDPHEWEDWLDEERERAAELFEQAEAIAEREGATIRTAVAVGRVHEMIVRYAADHDADMVVVGTHGRSTLKKALLGSVAEEVTRRSPVPVVTVR
ncbi:universal stress protein [Halomarina pelagica]|uniref:universal stress protein n=1 Tax=Halomarina pelagica TaxID=2961599 RepID=UPI0020C3DC52|nr:universal stress protein [Halomarina sp. BND7]